MDQRKLYKLQRELDGMRLRTVRAADDVQSLARRLGREPVNRGRHPMWESPEFRRLLPALAIPDHGGGRDLSPGVKKDCLDQLEDDIIAWDRKLSKNGSEL